MAAAKIITKKDAPLSSRLYWDEEEIKILKRLWLNRNVLFEDIEKVLVGRSKIAILRKADSLGLLSFYQARKSAIDRDYLKKLLEVVEG